MSTAALNDPAVRAIVRDEVERLMHPGLVDPRYYIHAEVRDPETGHVYRGMLYLVEPIAEVNDDEK